MLRLIFWLRCSEARWLIANVRRRREIAGGILQPRSKAAGWMTQQANQAPTGVEGSWRRQGLSTPESCSPHLLVFCSRRVASFPDFFGVLCRANRSHHLFPFPGGGRGE